MTALPSKLSALLRIAVEDAQKCEADPRYVLDMGSWHEAGIEEGRCSVCMAGAVMAQHLGADPSESLTTSHFDADCELLEAVDCMRTGDFVDAFTLARDEEPGTCDYEILSAVGEFVWRDYGHDAGDVGGRAPWPVYLAAAEILEKAGL